MQILRRTFEMLGRCIACGVNQVFNRHDFVVERHVTQAPAAATWEAYGPKFAKEQKAILRRNGIASGDAFDPRLTALQALPPEGDAA
jgi:hypothetical protein